jgi:hypothetical protein
MSSKSELPSPLIEEVAAVLSARYTHRELDNLFVRSGAPGDPPVASKLVKVSEWLHRTSIDPEVDPFLVLGRVLQELMDLDYQEQWAVARERIGKGLATYGLSYQKGGIILGGTLTTPTRSLEDVIRKHDLPALNIEFQRALSNVEDDPPTAITAACAIIETTCKTYITDKSLTFPKDQSIQPLWKTVRQHLGLDPSIIKDADMLKIISGLVSVVDGIGSLRTHSGSAHGQGPSPQAIEPRHARLAVHAAHTLVLFVLESWG